MTGRFLTLVETPTLVAAGYALVVIFFETLAVATVFGIWRLLHPAASAARQYLAGSLALTAIVILAASTPGTLRQLPAFPVASLQSGLEPPVVLSRELVGPLVTEAGSAVSAGPTASFPLHVIAGAIGLLWATGVLVLTFRLLGGSALAYSIRRRAAPVTDASTIATVERLQAALAPHRRVALLQSPHVEAPVVLGWRRPAVILPSGVTTRVAPEALLPILAHELTHVGRGDYIANVLQSLVELLLFFSPAVRWMSRRIREAREYRCDDAAVEQCDDPQPYVDALVTLAAMSTVTKVRPALGAAGPRLVTRVRRLLEGTTPPRYVGARVVGLALTFGLILLSGWRAAAISSMGLERLVPEVPTAVDGAAESQTQVPYGYGARDDSGVELSDVQVTETQSLRRITIRNVTIEPITAIRLVAVFEQLPWERPVRIFSSNLMTTRISPNRSVSFTDVTFPGLSDALRSPGTNQVFIGVQETRYANGAAWSFTPNPAALGHIEALGGQQPLLTRDFLKSQSRTPDPSARLCLDQNGKGYSTGAVVGVLREPGRAARCGGGLWLDYVPR